MYSLIIDLKLIVFVRKKWLKDLPTKNSMYDVVGVKQRGLGNKSSQ